MTQSTRSREDREAFQSGIAKALQVAFEPKEDAAEAEFDRLIERLARLSGGWPAQATPAH